MCLFKSFLMLTIGMIIFVPIGYCVPPEKFDFSSIPKEAGVVVISVGAPNSCTSAATVLHVAPISAPYKNDLMYAINVDNSFEKSDFSSHHGTLNIFGIFPGTYQVYPSILNPFFYPVKVPRAEFSIAAGEVLYIGEFYMPVACKFLGGSVQFRDQEDRDIKMLRERNSQFIERTIIKRIAKLNGHVLPKKHEE